MRLVLVELSRFFSRRAVLLLLVTAGLLTVLVAGSTIWSTRPISAADRSAAQAQVQDQIDRPAFREELATCLDDPVQYFGPGATAQDCHGGLTPTIDAYLDRVPLSLAEQIDGSGVPVVVMLTALMIIVGTTFAGADWSTGSIGNQLLFEPRRLRVWSAKAVAVVVGCAAVSALLLVGFWVALDLVAEARDLTTSAAVLGRVGWLVVRGVVLATLAGLGGYALTMLLRSTVASLALLFAYVVGGEALLTLAPVERSGRWSLTNNVFAWVRDGVRVYDQSLTCPPTSATCDQLFRLSLTHGALYLGVLLLVTMLVSALLFRRRDIP
jgi:ABC-2 type transport system permease protein